VCAAFTTGLAAPPSDLLGAPTQETGDFSRLTRWSKGEGSGRQAVHNEKHETANTESGDRKNPGNRA